VTAFTQTGPSQRRSSARSGFSFRAAGIHSGSALVVAAAAMNQKPGRGRQRAEFVPEHQQVLKLDSTSDSSPTAASTRTSHLPLRQISRWGQHCP